jgi:GNAT superfamily N-acetyltransferase
MAKARKRRSTGSARADGSSKATPRAARVKKHPVPPAASGPLRVSPVTADNWPDFEALFSARGSPHYCWCSVYRFRDSHQITNDARRERIRGLVQAGTPIGVLAYAGDVAVGWCSVAPRETYVKLERSRTMPRVSSAPTWTILCFFVRRAHRRQGVTHALLQGALDVARQHGAQVVEGYPHDTAGISSTHRGWSGVFRALGFQRKGNRWSYGTGAEP